MSQELLRFNKLDDSTVRCTNYIFRAVVFNKGYDNFFVPLLGLQQLLIIYS